MLTYLALHYWAGAGHEYDHLRSLLPAGAQLVAPDLPGYGRQAAPEGFNYSVASYADWVAAYTIGQRLSEYVLIGHSMGGKFALALAARQPTGLRGVVLLAPSPPSPEPISEKDRAASLAAYGQREEAEKTFANITSLPLSPALREQVIADNLGTSPAAWDAWLNKGAKEDISRLMARIEVPCRLLVGEDDRAIPLEAQRAQTLPLLPGGTLLTVVPGAGHLLPYEAPAACAVSLRLPFE